jgi:hypothetical protein
MTNGWSKKQPEKQKKAFTDELITISAESPQTISRFFLFFSPHRQILTEKLESAMVGR